MKIRIIGDVHCKFAAYENIIKEAEYSIQLGDFGLKHSWDKLSRHKIDPNKHKIILGNHEDYNNIDKRYTFISDYGRSNHNWIDGFDFFWIRGAKTPDFMWDHKYKKIEGKTWWEKEEISVNELEFCIDLYNKTKPELVLSHECPGDHTGISTIMFQKEGWIPNRTALAMQRMWNNHHPKLWIFGHWHRNMVFDFQGTTFVCLRELEYVDYEIEDGIGNDIDWNIVKIKERMRKLYNKQYSMRW